ncbi:hypothetical protein UFOVP776_12 [uncultured Caudovirales phage]|uniref:Uncharacterized protein n=1 Tax=uncultured Caudovirales phage TaxID=2100421 RepID=A0A6J5NRU6_9CAUD|nr:hypothetical protein UFOVP776_12 [uncultured Caudovirales phage]
MIRGFGIRAYRFMCTLGAAHERGVILLEDGFDLLQEDNGKIVLE